MLCVRSPASIANLGPGFDVVAIALREPFDVVCAEVGGFGADSVRFVGKYASAVPRDFRETTIYPVVEWFRGFTGRGFSVNVVINKGIKPASGLGSSGADAAAIAYLLNELLNTGLSARDLVRVAAQGEVVSAGAPHMDNVSASLLGGLVLINPLTGDVVKVSVNDNVWFVVVIAGSKVSTGEMRKVVPDVVGINEFKNNASYLGMIIYSLMSGDADVLGRAVMGDVIVEPSRAKLYGHYGVVKDALLKAGALGVALSGAGPSMFGVFKERPIIDDLVNHLRSNGARDFEVVVTRPSNQGVVEVEGLTI
ncbi:homoserine kinase [Vulcanisaeta thermophila]|uniref:homoserine kinase n=1 Tax=Vulcanisaeta thermophila TaxID=867917 RepID=UPI000853E0FD|nr:homoserine kinase [Vulcanisaeta thermophila]